MVGTFRGLPPKQKYNLIIDYPLSNHAVYNINTGKNGMSLLQLITKIRNLYHRVYKVDETSDRYEVWGHGIGDLVIEGIEIDHRKKLIRLGMGS